MRAFLPENLIKLAKNCPFPLYVVGGSVRDFLCGFPVTEKSDFDICSPAPEEEVLSRAKTLGFTLRAQFRHTGTLKLSDERGIEYEFTRFRSDKYVRGLHAPSEITFTDDILTDARRRDFTANAVYYEIASGTFCDPLNGMHDIQTKTLRTVAPAKKVFGEDGLRLLRLCRFAAQLGFTPDKDCISGAKTHAALICDIAPERVFHELRLLLSAERAHGVRDGVYRGLSLLRETGILPHILPELALGDGLAQRKDFHNYDVLEHSFRCACYATEEIRLAALLHDVGKPFCILRDGNSYAHPLEGARIVTEILTRLKAPKKLTEETAALVQLHMADLDCKMRESKVRRLIVERYPLLKKLLDLKQADFSACKDDFSTAPTVVRWKAILEGMEKEGAPRTMTELNVKGDDLLRLGFPPKYVGKILHELLIFAALDGKRNTRERLLSYAVRVQEKNL